MQSHSAARSNSDVPHAGPSVFLLVPEGYSTYQINRVAELHCTDSMKGLDVVGDAYVADCGPAVWLLIHQTEVKPLTSNKPQE